MNVQLCIWLCVHGKIFPHITETLLKYCFKKQLEVSLKESGHTHTSNGQVPYTHRARREHAQWLWLMPIMCQMQVVRAWLYERVLIKNG